MPRARSIPDASWDALLDDVVTEGPPELPADTTVPERHLTLVTDPTSTNRSSFIHVGGRWHEITHSGNWYDCDLETVLLYVRTAGYCPVYPGVL
jgi:hypothetical protein